MKFTSIEILNIQNFLEVYDDSECEINFSDEQLDLFEYFVNEYKIEIKSEKLSKIYEIFLEISNNLSNKLFDFQNKKSANYSEDFIESYIFKLNSILKKLDIIVNILKSKQI